MGDRCRLALAALNAPWPARCPPLLFLGTISYSLYLLHGAIGNGLGLIADRIAGFPPTLLLFLQIAASLSLASVFWWLIERPSTLLSRRLGRTDRPLTPQSAPQLAPTAVRL